MKVVLRMFALLTLGLLATACAPSASVTPTVEASTTQEQAANPPQDTEAPVSAETVNVTAARPQFLDSYADW